MFEGDLELARDFNRVGELRCAREHLEGALKKLEQIAALDPDGGASVPASRSPSPAIPALKNITP